MIKEQKKKFEINVTVVMRVTVGMKAGYSWIASYSCPDKGYSRVKKNEVQTYLEFSWLVD